MELDWLKKSPGSACHDAPHLDRNKAWAHWHLNDNKTRASQPISYSELVQRTGIEFLPGMHPN